MAIQNEKLHTFGGGILMQRHRPAERESRRNVNDPDYEREERFETEGKPARGTSTGRAASKTRRSPDVSSPGTRLSPQKKAGRRGSSSRTGTSRSGTSSRRGASSRAKRSGKSASRGRRASK
jgi:hypothetical protein